jgi:nicotinamidase/pyrazinamidase
MAYEFGPRTALVVVDIQNDFAHPDGSLYVKGAAQVIARANELITRAQEAGAPVFYTLDWHPVSTPHFQKDGGVWPVHCVAETWGSELHADLTLVGERVRKGVGGEDGYSGFTVRDPQTGETAPTTLEAALRQHDVATVVVIGLATDYCVVETAIDAAHLGFRTTAIRDAMAAVDLAPGDGDRALERMRQAGVEVV